MVAMVVAMPWPVARAMLRIFRTLITLLKIWPIEAKPKVLGKILERFHGGSYKNGCYAFGYAWQPLP